MSSDHDLLVSVSVTQQSMGRSMDALREDFKEFSLKQTELWENHVTGENSHHKGLERRINSAGYKLALLQGGLLLLSFLIGAGWLRFPRIL